MGVDVKDSSLRSSDKMRIFAAVVVAIIVIAAIGYFIFDMPAWMAAVGALAAIFVNGLLTLSGKKPK